MAKLCRLLYCCLLKPADFQSVLLCMGNAVQPPACPVSGYEYNNRGDCY